MKITAFIGNILTRVGEYQRDKFLSRDFSSTSKAESGFSGDLVTEVDYKSQDMIFSAVRTQLGADVLLVGEEKADSRETLLSKIENAPRVIIVDPLDGTINFAMGIPIFGCSIAYAERGVITAGGIIFPMLGELFLAEKGRGVLCNNKSITTQSQDSNVDVLFTAVGGEHNADLQMFALAKQLREQGVCRRINDLGCTVYSYTSVASGKSSAYINNGTSRVWDFAAGALIVQEAGGEVWDWKGAPWGTNMRSFVATSNSEIARDLLRSVQQLNPVEGWE